MNYLYFGMSFKEKKSFKIIFKEFEYFKMKACVFKKVTLEN